MSTAAPVTAKIDTSGWVAEWTSDPKPCTDACADALLMFSLDVVGVIVKLLKKPDVFGLKQLQEAYGAAELEKQAGGVVHELPLPNLIDVLLQTDLSDFFSETACAYWTGKKKVTDVFSLYFKPPNIMAYKVDKLAEKCGTQFYQNVMGVLFRDNEEAREASWILFPDEPIGCDLPAHDGAVDQLLLIPAHNRVTVPTLADASFCIFTKFACTRERIGGAFTRIFRAEAQARVYVEDFPDPHPLENAEHLKSHDTDIGLGDHRERGLCLDDLGTYNRGDPPRGVSPMWKFMIVQIKRSA